MNFPSMRSQRGMGAFGILLLFIVIILILLILDQTYIIDRACKDTNDIMECAINLFLGSDKNETPPQGSVTATGVISGQFAGENHSVTVHMTFPLQGGKVTGNFSGDCEGTLSGTFAGGDGGAISGSGSGSCEFVIPASGSFSGTVNTSAKTVNINGTGKAAGQSASGSLTLTY